MSFIQTIEQKYKPEDLDELIYTCSDNNISRLLNSSVEEQESFIISHGGFSKNEIENYNLSDLIITVCDKISSNINNEGIQGQVNYLINEAGFSEQDILNQL